MKRIFCMLIALILILCAQAFALKGSGYPAYDGTNFSDNHIAGNFADDALMLEFDPAGDYSSMDSSKIQACFFAFDESQSHYLELYIELPADVKSGDVFSSQDFLRNLSASAAISFYEIDADTEVLYHAGSVLGVPYPEGSSYEIRIDEANISETGAEISGSLNAALIRFDGNNPTGEALNLSDMRFHFLLSAGAVSAAPQPSAEPEVRPDEDKPVPPVFNPAPAFTLPPDYITL